MMQTISVRQVVNWHCTTFRAATKSISSCMCGKSNVEEKTCTSGTTMPKNAHISVNIVRMIEYVVRGRYRVLLNLIGDIKHVSFRHMHTHVNQPLQMECTLSIIEKKKTFHANIHSAYTHSPLINLFIIEDFFNY